MIKIILFLWLLISSATANNYFASFNIGASLNVNTTEYVSTNTYDTEAVYREDTTGRTDVKIGYSYILLYKLVLEPSFCYGSLNSSLIHTININKIYSIEVPLLYRIKNKKYGFFIKYNYLTDISIEGKYSDIIEFNDKKSWSVGFKTIFENRYIDFIVSYEYMLPGIYEQSTERDNETITTKLDIEGSYVSIGARFIF